MSNDELKDKLINRTVELFWKTDEPVYPVQEDYPNQLPVRYIPYDLNSAAFDAILETGILNTFDARPDLIRLIRELADEAGPLIPELAQVTIGRVALAELLNKSELAAGAIVD